MKKLLTSVALAASLFSAQAVFANEAAKFEIDGKEYTLNAETNALVDAEGKALADGSYKTKDGAEVVVKDGKKQ